MDKKAEYMFKAIDESRKKYCSGKAKNYLMYHTEILALLSSESDKLSVLFDAFDYGFIKGVRYAKAMVKKGERII